MIDFFEELSPIGREEFDQLFRLGSPEDARVALLRIVWHDPDHYWAEQQCVAALDDTRQQVRIAAATGLAHLARMQKGLGAEAMSRLLALKDDPHIGGQVLDALDDVSIFGRKDDV